MTSKKYLQRKFMKNNGYIYYILKLSLDVNMDTAVMKQIITFP